MTHRCSSLSRALCTLSLSLLVVAIGCDQASRNENFRPNGGSGGTSGSGGSGGTMDSGPDLDACDCADDDSGVSGSGGSGGSSGMDAGVDANVPPPSFTAMGLLTASAQCALGHYAEFETLAELLVNATDVLAQDPTPAHLTAAQDAWVAAMAAWQRAEVFGFGPAARSAQPGGQNLRDQIYFFPTLNRCLIDQQLVSQRYAMPTYATAQASSRGLAAIEYLLFYAGADNACDPAGAINAQGSWAALSSGALAQRRAEYAHAASADVLARVRTLIQAWEPSGGNFIAQWVAPGGSSEFATEHDALSAFITAIFYIDTAVKDAKLSIPLSIPLGGITECVNAPGTCPDRLESRLSRVSTDNIRQNLRAFRQAFQGCGPNNSGLGVDDWLRSLDQADLAERVLVAIDNADAAVNAVNPPLEDVLLQSPPTRALQLHAAVKAITDLFKTELLMVINVQLPDEAGGDLD